MNNNEHLLIHAQRILFKENAKSEETILNEKSKLAMNVKWMTFSMDPILVDLFSNEENQDLTKVYQFAYSRIKLQNKNRDLKIDLKNLKLPETKKENDSIDMQNLKLALNKINENKVIIDNSLHIKQNSLSLQATDVKPFRQLSIKINSPISIQPSKRILKIEKNRSISIPPEDDYSKQSLKRDMNGHFKRTNSENGFNYKNQNNENMENDQSYIIKKPDFRSARDMMEEANKKNAKSSNNFNDGSKQRMLFSNSHEENEEKKFTKGQNKFVTPFLNKNDSNATSKPVGKKGSGASNNAEEVDERLKNIEPRMIELIKSEMLDQSSNIGWDDIAGLAHVKKAIIEMVIYPMMRPDLFTALRRAAKGLLLFGPPGTGKTMIGKCIASQASYSFFSISASSLTSKWVGEGEKMVRALFAVARVHSPSVIFVDEIDSLLTQRSDSDNEASRRIKTEFLIQFDGAHVQNPDDDNILLIGATNRPQELDEAARRRLIKRFYIPLPDKEARAHIIRTLIKSQVHTLSEEDIQYVAEKTAGYSGSDMDGLCRESALGPIREIPPDQIQFIPLDQVRPLALKDFIPALSQVKASVSSRDLEMYNQWNKDYGAMPISEQISTN